VRQNPIQRTVSLFICVRIALCTIVAHNIAQNRHLKHRLWIGGSDEMRNCPVKYHITAPMVHCRHREGGQTSRITAESFIEYTNCTSLSNNKNRTNNTVSKQKQRSDHRATKTKSNISNLATQQLSITSHQRCQTRPNQWRLRPTSRGRGQRQTHEN